MLRIEQDIATQRLRSLAAVDRIAAEQLALRDSLASQQKDLLAAAEEGVQKRLEMAAELLKYREAAAKVTDALDNGVSQIPQFLLNSVILGLVPVLSQYLLTSSSVSLVTAVESDRDGATLPPAAHGIKRSGKYGTSARTIYDSVILT
jgi:hypothetical protein